MKKLLLFFLLPAIFLLACGEESPEEALNSTAQDLIEASQDRDWPAFCDSLNKESQANLVNLLNVKKGSSCPEALETRSAIVGDRIEEQARDNQIERVEVKGGKGAVLVKTPNGEQVLPAVLENGEWKLNVFPAAQ